MADVSSTSTTAFAPGEEGSWEPDFNMDFGFGQYMAGAEVKGQQPVMMEAGKEDLEFLGQADLSSFGY